jgi:hypothetical protein
MKAINYSLLLIATVLTVSCDKQKAAIDDSNEATKTLIDNRKDEVDANAKEAVKQTEINADIDKARIEADKVASQAQLDADKKKADADAEAAKAEVDALNK